MGFLNNVGRYAKAIGEVAWDSWSGSNDDDDYDDDCGTSWDDNEDDDGDNWCGTSLDDDFSLGIFGRMAVPVDQRDERRSFYPNERRQVRERDGENCHVCGKPTDENRWDCDHYIPHSHGGRTDVENGRVSHPECNRHSKRDHCVPDCENGQNMSES